jgi:hypothetical protein
MSDRVELEMLPDEYDDAFLGLSYNMEGVPFPCYSLDECARIASEEMDVTIDEAVDGIRQVAVVRRIIFVEEMPMDRVPGLRGVH